jgi:hypothetical protein
MATLFVASSGCRVDFFTNKEWGMNLDEFDERIHRDCQPYLALLRSGAAPLYRGDRPHPETIFERQVSRNRVPTKMPIELHEASDRWFSRVFGVRYRSAALFCTGDLG